MARSATRTMVLARSGCRFFSDRRTMSSALRLMLARTMSCKRFRAMAWIAAVGFSHRGAPRSSAASPDPRTAPPPPSNCWETRLSEELSRPPPIEVAVVHPTFCA